MLWFVRVNSWIVVSFGVPIGAGSILQNTPKLALAIPPPVCANLELPLERSAPLSHFNNDYIRRLIIADE